ncbi:MAG: ATP-binding protein [Rubrobacteraceae bacterium]
MKFGFQIKVLTVAVAVVLISATVMLLYIVFAGNIAFFEPISLRVLGGAVLAVALAGVLVFLPARLITHEAEFRKVQEKDETLSAILDNLKEGVLATNLDGRVMFANPVACSILGIGGAAEDPEEVQRLPDPWEDFDLPRAVSHCAREQECGEARVQDSESLLRVNLEHMPAFDDHKGGVLVVMQDLSEGRRLEANQHRFLTNAAHELRTPLSNIAFAAELLTSGADEDPAARRRFLEHILASAYKMQRLSEALLKLARVGWGGREPKIEPTEPERVVCTAVESVQPLAENSGVTLSCKGEAATVLADATLLEQALLALVSNAIKHSTEGDEVTVRLDGATIFVQDQGGGISAAELPHVFQRFYRSGDDSRGFGLGLSICKEIIESMEGEISIRSKENVGTTVQISLPEADEDD